MKKLISDRRLWTTADGDQVVEDLDPRARFLLVGCAGRTIPASVAERLGLEIEDGRIIYPGADLGVLNEGEGGAEVIDEKDDGKTHRFGGDETGGRDKIDPPPGDEADTSRRADPKGGAESAVAADDLAERRAAAEALQEEKAEARRAELEAAEAAARKGTQGEADDSDRNDDPAPEWKLKTAPAEYLKKWPDGKNAELAKAVLAAQDAGADGGS